MATNYLAPSSPTSSAGTSNYDWAILEDKKSKKDLDAYIEKFIPRSHVYQTNKNVNCYFCVNDFEIENHKLKRQYRKCKDEASCSVKYRVDYCEKKDVGRIEENGEHTHDLEDAYENENGICEEIKAAILKILQFNPTKFPKQIQMQLTTEKEKFGIQHLEIPDLVKIQGFVHRSRHKVKPVSNKVDDVLEYVMRNLMFPTIHENTPFFFGLQHDSSNKIILGKFLI